MTKPRGQCLSQQLSEIVYHSFSDCKVDLIQIKVESGVRSQIETQGLDIRIDNITHHAFLNNLNARAMIEKPDYVGE